jgi:hypothetical protein
MALAATFFAAAADFGMRRGGAALVAALVSLNPVTDFRARVVLDVSSPGGHITSTFTSGKPISFKRK